MQRRKLLRSFQHSVRSKHKSTMLRMVCEFPLTLCSTAKSCTSVKLGWFWASFLTNSKRFGVILALPERSFNWVTLCFVATIRRSCSIFGILCCFQLSQMHRKNSMQLTRMYAAVKDLMHLGTMISNFGKKSSSRPLTSNVLASTFRQISGISCKDRNDLHTLLEMVSLSLSFR